jgi:hypothetical protein
MAVSASTLRPIFNVGSFSQTTGLTLPSTSLSNKISFDLPLPIYPQIPDVEYFSTLPADPSVSVLAKVLFNGQPWYENAQYASPPEAVPTAPEFEIFVWGVEDPPENQTFETTVPIPLALNSSGVPQNGRYDISLIYVYQDDNLDWFADEVTYAPINFVYEAKTPELTYSYDSSPSNPFLTLGDSTNYQINGVTASTESEYILYPPKSGTPITTVVENSNSLTFNSFKTGGNEFKLTTLLTYEFTLFDLVTVVQDYEAFTVYLINNCAIYDCLNTLYNKYKNTTCSTKAEIITQRNLVEANALAMKLLTGQGCDKSLSDTLNQFNLLCGCDCDCLDDTVRVIQRSIAVEDSQFQIITASGTNTTIDLREGRNVRVITAINTEIFINPLSIVDFETYSIQITASAGTPTVTWDSDTVGWSGGVPVDSEPTVGSYDMYTFKGNETLQKIMLTSQEIDVN